MAEFAYELKVVWKSGNLSLTYLTLQSLHLDWFNNDTCARGQNGDFTLPEGAITRARAKKLKESFRNLATLIHEEMYQLLAKEKKIKPIVLNVENPKSCLEIHWT
ncbi:hypothetical protein PIB30_088086 [Stylosanthes scabra]|uniref:Uncharacterized protein n=1 Tax=Stylosanthes scabra TaxID=79078 RepID=A0ABU6RTH5_9FABA|nr:hypothetical protein [Stylosanthes scabra]